MVRKALFVCPLGITEHAVKSFVLSLNEPQSTLDSFTDILAGIPDLFPSGFFGDIKPVEHRHSSVMSVAIAQL